MMDRSRTAPDIHAVSMALCALEEGTISRANGYQAYALLLRILGASEPALAEELHGLDGPKPFTVSELRGKFGRSGDRLRVIPGTTYYLRLTFLKSELFARFMDGTLRWGDSAVEVDSVPFRMGEVNPDCRKDSVSAFTSYQGIMDGASAGRHIALKFTSPTVFRSGGKRNVVFPEPQLVFGSYLNRWQAFSTVKLDDSIAAWFSTMLLTRYRLETMVMNFGSYQEAGFTGKCRYELEKDTPEKVAIELNTLADFASFCGTGAKTTMGMGQTKKSRNGSQAAMGKR